METIDISSAAAVDLRNDVRSSSSRSVHTNASSSRPVNDQRLFDEDIFVIYFGKHFMTLMNRDIETGPFPVLQAKNRNGVVAWNEPESLQYRVRRHKVSGIYTMGKRRLRRMYESYLSYRRVGGRFINLSAAHRRTIRRADRKYMRKAIQRRTLNRLVLCNKVEALFPIPVSIVNSPLKDIFLCGGSGREMGMSAERAEMVMNGFRLWLAWESCTEFKKFMGALACRNYPGIFELHEKLVQERNRKRSTGNSSFCESKVIHAFLRQLELALSLVREREPAPMRYHSALKMTKKEKEAARRVSFRRELELSSMRRERERRELPPPYTIARESLSEYRCRPISDPRIQVDKNTAWQWIDDSNGKGKQPEWQKLPIIKKRRNRGRKRTTAEKRKRRKQAVSKT